MKISEIMTWIVTIDITTKAVICPLMRLRLRTSRSFDRGIMIS